MKKILVFVSLAIVCLYSFTGCDKQTEYPNSVVGTIDTIAYTASGTPAVIFHADTTTHNPQMTVITSTTSIYTPGTTTQPGITLRVPNAEGYYAVPGSATASVVTSASGSGGSAAVSGWIQVSEKSSSGRFEGTFSFTTTDGTVVKSGQFDGTLSYY